MQLQRLRCELFLVFLSKMKYISYFVFPLMCEACGQVRTLYCLLHGLRLKVKGVLDFDL